MISLTSLINEFWKWTGLPEEKWGNVDFEKYGVEGCFFPKLGELCQNAVAQINCVISCNQMDDFLTAMAIDAEDETILSACKEYADNNFIAAVVLQGISHVQSAARWQLAELLYRPIQNRNASLQVLLEDPDEYVRKRARNVLHEASILAYRVTAWDRDAQDAVVEIDISLPEDSKASVSTSERNVATVRAYCHPINEAPSTLNTVLFALGVRDIVSEKVFRLPNKTADGYFSYHLFAKVMDVAEAVVCIGDMKIILDTALPKDICKGDCISFDVLRVDCTFD